MKNSLGFIKSILSELESHNLIDVVEPGDRFFDEPNVFHFNGILKSRRPFLDSHLPGEIVSTGVSFKSKEDALLKCLAEFVERLALYCYRKKDFLLSSFLKLEKFDALDPAIFVGNKGVARKRFHWTKTISLNNQHHTYAPAQLIFLNIPQLFPRFKEVLLSPMISTGAAAGFLHEEILLRGIFETVERDAFITTYLNKIKVTRINPVSVKNPTIHEMVNKLKQYDLEPAVFDITNDLDIPTFMTFIVDRTGVGPALCVGLRCGLDIPSAVMGSIQEAVQSRIWLRKLLFQNGRIRQNKRPPNSLYDRAFLWMFPHSLKKLDFLLTQKLKVLEVKADQSGTKKKLEAVKKRLIRKGFKIYYRDITPTYINTFGLKVYKVLIPGLQPLYLKEDEKHTSLQRERLSSVASFFGKKEGKMNKIPHPFL